MSVSAAGRRGRREARLDVIGLLEGSKQIGDRRKPRPVVVAWGALGTEESSAILPGKRDRTGRGVGAALLEERPLELSVQRGGDEDPRSAGKGRKSRQQSIIIIPEHLLCAGH